MAMVWFSNFGLPFHLKEQNGAWLIYNIKEFYDMTERVTTESKWDIAVYAVAHTMLFQKLFFKHKFY